MSDVAALGRALQERLLASAGEYPLFGVAALDARERDAFFAVPRHRFVPRSYREAGLAIGVDSHGDAVTICGVGAVRARPLAGRARDHS